MNVQDGRGRFHHVAQDMDGMGRDYPRGTGSSANIAARDSEIGSKYAAQGEGAFVSSSVSSHSFSTGPERGFAVPSEKSKRGIRGGFPRPPALQAQRVPSVNRGFQPQGQVCENGANSSHNSGFGSYNSPSSLPQHNFQTEYSDFASFDQYSTGLKTFEAYVDPISEQLVNYDRSYNTQPRHPQNRETVRTGGFNTDDQYDHEVYMQSLNHVQESRAFDSDAQVDTNSAVSPEFIPLDTHPFGLSTFDPTIDPIAQRQINYGRGFDVEHRNQRAQGPNANHQPAPDNDRFAKRAAILAELERAKIRQANRSSRRGRPTGRGGRSRGGHLRHANNNGRSTRIMPSKTDDNGEKVVPDRPILVGDADLIWNSLNLTIPSTNSSRDQKERQAPSSAVAIANLLKANLTKNTSTIDKCGQRLLEKTECFMSFLEDRSIHLDAESLSLLIDDATYPPQLKLRAAQQMPRPVIIDGCAVAVAYNRRFASLWKGKTRNAFFHKDRILPIKPLVQAAIHFIARGHKVVIVLPEFYMEPYIAEQKVCKVDDLEAFNTMRGLGLIRFIDPLTEPVVDLHSRIREFVREVHGCFFSHPDIKFSYNYKENNSAQEEEGLLMDGALDQQKIQKAEENSDERMMTISFGGPQKTMYVVRQFSLYAGLTTESKEKTNYRYVSEEIVLFYSENDGDQHNYGKRMEQQITFYEQVVQTLSLCGLHKISPITMRCVQKILLIAIKANIHIDEIKQFVDKYSERSGAVEEEKEEEQTEECLLLDCEAPLDIVVHDPVESLVDVMESLTTEGELLIDMDPLVPTSQ